MTSMQTWLVYIPTGVPFLTLDAWPKRCSRDDGSELNFQMKRLQGQRMINRESLGSSLTSDLQYYTQNALRPVEANRSKYERAPLLCTVFELHNREVFNSYTWSTSMSYALQLG